MEIFVLASLSLWLIPVVSSGTNNLVELRTSELVAGPCHSSVTLHCNISQEQRLRVDSLSWIRASDHKILCVVTKTELTNFEEHRTVCNYTPQTQLALTISHLWPTDQGEYICKLWSNRGMKNSKSEVKVQECYRRVDAHPSLSEVACHFYGVYPQGEVHWFHRGKNVTSSSTAVNPSKPNHKGMYNVSSILQPAGDSNEYNCSLWIPETGTYLTSRLVHVPALPQSRSINGSATMPIVGLAWFLIQAIVFIV